MKQQLELRIEAIQQELTRFKLDGLVVQNPISSLYLTNFQCSNSLILITRRHGLFFTDFRYIKKAETEISHLEVIRMQQNSLTDLAARTKRLRLRKLGFEETIMFAQYKALGAALDGGVELVPAGGIIRSLRMIKTAGEARQIAANQRLNERIFKTALDGVQIGSTELAIRQCILSEMIKANCEEAFQSIIAAGRNSANPHAVAGSAKVKSGAFLLFDMGVKKLQYHSDMTRTVAVGKKLPARALEIYEVVKSAQQAALKLVRPGASCSDVDSAARKIISDAGYGDYFGHGLGHGVGLEIHEGPTLNPTSSAILQSGMVITIEPGIYLPDLGGVRIEDLVLVTDQGYRNLTTLPKELLFVSV